MSLIAAVTLAFVACGSVAEPPPPRVIPASDAENGQSVSIHVGEILRVTLRTTAWTFAAPSDPSVLKEEGDTVVSPAPMGACLPGMNCGITTAQFRALKAGTSTVSASRLSCGEARRCVGAEGVYQLTVIVS